MSDFKFVTLIGKGVLCHIYMAFFICLVFGSHRTFSIDSNKKIVIFSVPKAGTFLIGKLVTLMTNKEAVTGLGESEIIDGIKKLSPKHYILTHQSYNIVINAFLETTDVSAFVMCRDPRDQLISLAFWIKKNPNWYDPKLSEMDFDRLLMYLMSDYDYSSMVPRYEITPKGINLLYRSFTPWLSKKYVCMVRFEDLIGPLGGGDKRIQEMTIQRIANHIGLILDNNTIENLAQNLYGETWTFRQGEIGEWKKYFRAEHKEIFKKFAGQLLIELGYEDNFNW